MVLKTGILVILVGIVVVGMMVSSVSAKDDSMKIDNFNVYAIIKQLSDAGKNASEIWARLSDEEKKSVMNAMTVTTITRTVVQKDMIVRGGGIRCRVVQIDVCGKNIFGMNLYCYFQRIEWCFDGSRIRDIFRTRWGEVYFPFWSYEGHIGNSESEGIGRWFYRAWTQGYFRLCMGGDIGCIQHRYPWIDQTVFGDGTSRHRTSAD